MKKTLLLLISIIFLQNINIKAEGTGSEIKKIFAFGKEIQQELEQNLSIEFKKRSDDIFQKIYIFDDLVSKRFQANSRVDLTEVLDSSMDKTMMSKIEDLKQQADIAISKILNRAPILFARFREIESKKPQESRWPHTSAFLQEMKSYGFEFISGINFINRDKMICNSCKSEPSDLCENDLPLYYHKENCKLLNQRNIKKFTISSETDSKLTVQQRIRYAHLNKLPSIQPMHKNISELLTEPLGSIINSYLQENYNTEKLNNFLVLYKFLGQIPGWIIIYNFITDASCSGSR